MAKRKVRSVTINVAKNGYSVTCDYAPEKGSKAEHGLMSYEPPEPVVFNNMKDLLDHVEDELESSTEGSAEERAEGEKKPKVRVLGVAMIRHDKKRKEA